MSSSPTSSEEEQLRTIRSSENLNFTGAGEAFPPPFGKHFGRADANGKARNGVAAGGEFKDAPVTFISKSARKRSKKRMAKKEIMNIMDFCNGLAKSASAGDTTTRSPPSSSLDIASSASVTGVCPPQQTASSSNNSYAAVVSGKGSQDAFVFESDISGRDIDGKPFEPEEMVDAKTSVTPQFGHAFAVKEFNVQQTQVEGSDIVGRKKDAATQADLGGPKIRFKIDKPTRAQGTMTEAKADKKRRTADKAVTAKLCSCDDQKSSRPPVEFLGEQFRFEDALAMAVTNLGVTFLDDGEDHHTVHNGVEFQTYLPPDYICPFQFY